MKYEGEGVSGGNGKERVSELSFLPPPGSLRSKAWASGKCHGESELNLSTRGVWITNWHCGPHGGETKLPKGGVYIHSSAFRRGGFNTLNINK